MAITQQFLKAPLEVLDYQIDWSTWLDSDTISASVWSLDTGIVNDSDNNSTTDTTVWISSGTDNTTYTAENTITTAAGRTAIRSFKLLIDER
jgi:hypothetical protein